uniref:Uncharacterized protein n=1 Tax=Psilocybe cubensis TaxID=181762 RepID=A0A8H8CES5_PSICU
MSFRRKVPRPSVRDTPSPTPFAGVAATVPSTGNTKLAPHADTLLLRSDLMSGVKRPSAERPPVPEG